MAKRIRETKAAIFSDKEKTRRKEQAELEKQSQLLLHKEECSRLLFEAWQKLA